MKKNLNVIQIRGIKGLMVLFFAGCCLFAGFIVFPGLVCMHIWNYISLKTLSVPSIGTIQGILLWGIIIVSYFTFRKEKLVVCFKGSQGLSEEELKSVFTDLKRQADEDKILQAMLKAREAEMKIKQQETKDEKETVEQHNN